MYINKGTNGIIPNGPSSAKGPKAILYPNQLQFRNGIVSTKSYAKKTYANKMPKAKGAYFIESIPALRSLILFLVSFTKSSDAPTVKM